MKKRKLFWILYTTLTLLFLVLGTVFLFVLHSYLAALEQSQPHHAAERVFQEYFVSDHIRSLMERTEFCGDEFFTADQYAAHLSRKMEGKELAFYAAPSGTDEKEKQYNVVIVEKNQTQTETETPLLSEEEDSSFASGSISLQGIPSEKIATLTFSPSEQTDSWGFCSYEFSDAEFFFDRNESVEITLFHNQKFLINGKEVPQTYETTRREHEYNAFLPEGAQKITLVTYRVDGLLEAPSVSVVLENGETVSPLWNEKTQAFESFFAERNDLKERYGTHVLDGMKAYAKWMQNDGSLSDVRPYFDLSGPFYKSIQSNLSYVLKHDAYRFENESVREFYAFGEKSFCCHVSFEHVLSMEGKSDYRDVLDMIVFVKQTENGILIYDSLVL